jgi:anti-sigma B factor antagonist
VGPELTLETVEVGGAAVVRVGGEIDMSNASRLRESLSSLAQGPQKMVVVDLEGVSFMDSTGLGALVSARERLSSGDTAMVLVANNSRVLRLLEISGLGSAFELAPSVGVAVRSRGDDPGARG